MRQYGLARLRHPKLSLSGKPLVMRLMIGDPVGIEFEGVRKIYRLSSMASAGTLAFAQCHEANVDKRTRSKELSYLFKTAGSWQNSNGRVVGISPTLKDNRAKAAIVYRFKQVANGHLGDVKNVGDGVSELCWHIGPGYRVYFTRQGDHIVLLLAGGDKSSQARDIAKAKALAKEHSHDQNH